LALTFPTASLDLDVQHRRGRLFITLAAIAWSTAGLLQRELSVATATQLAGRALFAILALLAYTALAERGRVVQAFRAIGRSGFAVAALMAVASGSFIVALNHASVANVLFMQALAPLLAAAMGTLLGEPVPRRTWLAMSIALTGVALMVGGPGHPHPLGAGLSLLMTTSFAGTIAITRHRRDVSMAPATCLSQLFVLIGALPFAFAHMEQIGDRDLSLLAALGIGQMGLGLVFLTIGARLIPAAEIALITLLEIVLAPLWVWIALSEQPSAATLIGGAIVLCAVVIQARRDLPQPQAASTEKSVPPTP
jgi:drug/metabolite transporter (DMT)-like permease